MLIQWLSDAGAKGDLESLFFTQTTVETEVHDDTVYLVFHIITSCKVAKDFLQLNLIVSQNDEARHKFKHY